jgi:LacI family transcriptional regulator
MGRAIVTIADVARRAGVSTTTVSHALSGRRPVAADTRERVADAVRDLGFRPNGVARSLRLRSTLTAALVIPDITNPFYPVLARGLQDALARDGYHVMVCNTDGRPDREREYLGDAIDRRLSGIVIARTDAEPLEAELGEAIAHGVAVVAVNGTELHPDADLVRTDDEAGVQAVVAHLVAGGHTRIARIGGGGEVGRVRAAGFDLGLAAAGLVGDPALVRQGDWTRAGGHEAMHALLGAAPRPTAVFCANDLMALGAMDACREHGVRVPDDVALAGYDDIEAAALVAPALTTIPNPAYAIGETSGRLLLERMRGDRREARLVVLQPGALCRRASA